MSTEEEQLAEFRAFNSGDPSKPAFNPVTASPEEFEQFLEGGQPDIEGMARKAKADKDAVEIEEYRQFARMQMESRGYDVERHEWRKAEPVEEDLMAPMGPIVDSVSGAPIVSPERWESYVESESPLGSLSERQFEALLASRDAGKPAVFEPDEPTNDEVNETYQALLGDLVED